MRASLSLDLLWADPDQWSKGWQVIHEFCTNTRVLRTQPNTRGASYTFGADVVSYTTELLGIDMVARAHQVDTPSASAHIKCGKQVVQDGYEFFAHRRLVTIFSAPHYCGQFDNHAATMRVRIL